MTRVDIYTKEPFVQAFLEFDAYPYGSRGKLEIYAVDNATAVHTPRQSVYFPAGRLTVRVEPCS